MDGRHPAQAEIVVGKLRHRARLMQIVAGGPVVAGMMVGIGVAVRSEVSEGAVLEEEIITRPASLRIGEAAVAATEQDVPMTPTTRGSPVTVSAAARPPSSVQSESRPAPISTSCPLIGP